VQKQIVNDSQFLFLQKYLLPKRALTVTLGTLSGIRGGALTHAAVRRFIAIYGVNMAEAADPAIEHYATFNDFFTRALRVGVRPLSDAPWICPVDGAISQCGAITGDRIFQAKGHDYSTQALVGGDAALAAHFENGSFATLYLAPKDYHRIHMPCGGRLVRMIHVPGSLYSVNPTTARGIPNLFARNERVVCVFESDRGPFVLALVGATIVGSMATVWHGVVNPPRPRTVREWIYDGNGYKDKPVILDRGAEMGRFLLGSTVVMLFPPNTLRFDSSWRAEKAVRLGEAMASSL
jgi:phosphatidylserine decarboxylase